MKLGDEKLSLEIINLKRNKKGFLIKWRSFCITKSQRRGRGVSEIISMLLMIGITVVGGILIMSFFSEGNIVEISDEIVKKGTVKTLLVSGYDTHDSKTLSGIVNMNNKLDNKLCTKTCKTNTNKIPSSSGTEFIVLKIRNIGPNFVTLENILVNNIAHTWDTSTADVILDTSADSSSGKYPSDGKFSIISLDNNTPINQRANNILEPTMEVRVVVKLSGSIEPDISLRKAIVIFISDSELDLERVVITSGDVK